MLTAEDLADATRIVAEHVPVTPAYRWPLLEQITGSCPAAIATPIWSDA